MAAGLFASLFAVTSSPSAAESSSSSSESTDIVSTPVPEQEAARHMRTSSHETTASSQDVIASSVQPSVLPSEPLSTDTLALKEAQEVADVDMQLSSPPSSPPRSAPATPQDMPASPAPPRSTKMEPSSSYPGNSLSPDSVSTATASERVSFTGRPGSNSTQAIHRTTRRRMMPARLSQVSSLLAGSTLEEELLSLEPVASPTTSSFLQDAGSNSKYLGGASAPIAGRHNSDSTLHARSTALSTFTTSSIVVLTSDPQVLERADRPYAPALTDSSVKLEKTEDDLSLASIGTPTKPSDTAGFLRSPAPASSSLVSTLAIKRQQLIETPDFKPRDDTLYMPKTRGLRSDAAEDTSDAAYERRHRKPETAELRQRKAEVDRLSRDRQKLLARIEQLKTVEGRMLQPIVIARDQVRAEASANDDGSKPTSADAKPLHERVEDVRQELLADAHETLKRYDLLLSTTGNASRAVAGPSLWAEKPRATTAADHVARNQSPGLKIRIKGGRATRETSASASPTTRQSAPAPESIDSSRRSSSRQPKQRVESLPTPLTAATVEAVEDSRRKRGRLSSLNADDTTSAKRSGTASYAPDTTPTKGRGAPEAVSLERRARRRGSPEVGGTYKGKMTPRNENHASSARTKGRPQRAAAAAAAVASARQRKCAERSLSDFDYDEEDEEAMSALEDADALYRPNKTVTRRASGSLRPSHVQARDQRSSSASSTSSSVSSIASSIGYMYPTVPETGSLRVSQSLAEIQAADPDAMPSPLVTSQSQAGSIVSPRRDDRARKRLKSILPSSPSASDMEKGGGEARKVLAEVLDPDTDEKSSDRVAGKSFGSALTESEAESILAAFLGTTPVGKSAKLAALMKPKSREVPVEDVATEAPVFAAERTPAPTPAASQSHGTLSKRRSTRRETTQSFGEKLPDLLTKSAQFDFTVMGYFRSIDRPSKATQSEQRDKEGDE